MLAAITHESHGSRNRGTGPRHGTTCRLSRFVISSARTHTDTHTGPDRCTHTNTRIIDTNARDAAAATATLHHCAAPQRQHQHQSRQHDTGHGATPRCCTVLHWHRHRTTPLPCHTDPRHTAPQHACYTRYAFATLTLILQLHQQKADRRTIPTRKRQTVSCKAKKGRGPLDYGFVSLYAALR